MGSDFRDTLAPGSSSMSKYFPKKDRHAPLASNYNTLTPYSGGGPNILLTDNNRKQVAEQSRREYIVNKTKHVTELCPKDLITDARIKEPSYSRLMNETYSKNKHN